MKIEDQVCSLELAKRLRALGVKQESQWYYRRHKERENPEYERIYPPSLIPIDYPLDTRDGDYYLPGEYDISAFTVAELGEKLSLAHYSFRSGNVWDESRWECSYGNSNSHIANTEADARAKLLIYLIENELIKQAEGEANK